MPVIPLHGTPTYQGEVLLLGWSENNRDGMTVRLALDASDEGTHPFKGLGTGKMGQRFMAVLVPIGDDELPTAYDVCGILKPAADTTPAAQPVASKPRPPGQKWDEMSHAQQAGILCNEAEFQRYLGVDDAEAAKRAVYDTCVILSRRELDQNEEAAARWNRMVKGYRDDRAEQTGQEQVEAQAREYGR